MRQISDWRSDVRRRRRALRAAILMFVLLALAATGGSGWYEGPSSWDDGSYSGWLD